MDGSEGAQLTKLGNIESGLLAAASAKATEIETETERFFRRMDRRYARILQWASTKEKDEVADHLAFLLLFVFEQGKSARIVDDVKNDLLRSFASEQKKRHLNAINAADALHGKPDGSREKQGRIREAWASGKYTSRDRCAEEECGAIGMSFSAARKALRNTPNLT
jgi:hypothetical protein